MERIRKYLIRIAIILGITLLIAFIFSWIFSFNIALLTNGIRANQITVFDRDFDANGNEVKIITSETFADEPILAYLEKSSLGFWRLVYSDEFITEDGLKKERLAAVLMKPTGLINFSKNSGSIFTSETNHYYYGRNAVKAIDLSRIDIPKNVAISVHQSNSEYWIHLTICSNSEEVRHFSIIEALSEKGFLNIK